MERYIDRKREVAYLRQLNEEAKQKFGAEFDGYKIVESGRNIWDGHMEYEQTNDMFRADYVESADVDGYTLDLSRMKVKAIDFYKTQMIAEYKGFKSNIANRLMSLETFKNENQYNDGTKEQYRRDYAYKTNTKVAKIDLTAYTMSSYNGADTRSKSHCEKCANSIVCIDFDNVAQEDANELLKWLCEQKYVFMISKSISGAGLYCLIRHAFAGSQLKAVILAIKNEMPINFQHYVDLKCTDCSRLRGYSDFKQYWRADDFVLEAFDKIYVEDTAQKTKQFSFEYDEKDKDETKKECMKYFKRLQSCKYLDTSDYNAWYALLKNIYTLTGSDGEDVARHVSMKSNNYNESEFVKKWRRVCSENDTELNLGYWKNRERERKKIVDQNKPKKLWYEN